MTTEYVYLQVKYHIVSKMTLHLILPLSQRNVYFIVPQINTLSTIILPSSSKTQALEYIK